MIKPNSVRIAAVTSFLLFVVFSQSAIAAKKWFPGHYIYTHGTGTVSAGMQEGPRRLVLNNPIFRGYHGLYFWSDLETAPGVYDFSRVKRDLDRAQADGKKLIVMFMDTNWKAGDPQSPVPSYILTDPIYQGGTFLKAGGGGTVIATKLWVPAVGDRRAEFFTALGAAIDTHPALALVVFPETALARNPDLANQPGYSAVNLYANFRKVHTAASNAFPNTIVIQYVNWGNYQSTIPQRDAMMAYLVETLREGFGGPDTLGAGAGTLETTHFGKYFGQYAGVAPIAMSAQSSNYKQNDPKTVFDYAVDAMGAHFVSWAPVQYNWGAGYVFSINEVIAYVNAQNGRVNNATPSNVASVGGGGQPLSPPTGVNLIVK